MALGLGTVEEFDRICENPSLIWRSARTVSNSQRPGNERQGGEGVERQK